MSTAGAHLPHLEPALGGEHAQAGWRLSLFCGGVAGALLLQREAPASLVAMVAFAAVSIAMWHGAFDMVLGEELFPRRSPVRGQLLFVSMYAAAALAAGMLWWLAPFAALTAFLLYSAWHFGTESLVQLEAGRALCSYCYGAIPIAAACHWHTEQVTAVFAAMLRVPAAHSPAAQITAFVGAALWPLTGGFALGIAARPRLPLFWWAALAAELVLFRFAAPLPAFAVYFCLWHTPEHLLGSSLDGSGCFSAARLWVHLRRGLWPWLLSLAALVGLCLLLRGRLLQDESALFILLSALTVPHMLLNEVRRQSAGRHAMHVGGHQ